jgi:hypothetical protein
LNSQANYLKKGKAVSTTIQAKLPDALWQQAQAFVQRGWAVDMEDLIAESLRRYLESHEESLAEQFILEDVDWGLRGND